MKKFLIPIFLAMPAAMLAQGGDFTIKGKVGTLNAPAQAFIRYTVGDIVVADSVVLKDGAFEFKGKVEGLVRSTLQLYPNGKPSLTARSVGSVDFLSVYLEKGTIIITTPDSLKKAEIKGSKLNADNAKLQASLKAVNAKSSALNEEYRALTPEQRKDETIKAGLDKKSEVISAERKLTVKKFIDENPNSLICLDALRTYAGSVPEYSELAPVYASLSAEVRKSPDGIKFGERIARIKATAIGAQAPEFTQNDTSGIPVKLASFRGKYVLIDFWASWCGPCRAENPNVVKAFDKYKAKNFTVLGVSLDQPNAKDKWLKAIYTDNLTWTHVSDLAYWKNEVAQQYAVNAIPQNFLIDPKGKIIAKNIRGEELQTKLAELIN